MIIHDRRPSEAEELEVLGVEFTWSEIQAVRRYLSASMEMIGGRPTHYMRRPSGGNRSDSPSDLRKGFRMGAVGAALGAMSRHLQDRSRGSLVMDGPGTQYVIELLESGVAAANAGASDSLLAGVEITHSVAETQGDAKAVGMLATLHLQQQYVPPAEQPR